MNVRTVAIHGTVANAVTGVSPGLLIAIGIIISVLFALAVIAYEGTAIWKVYKKANRPGWAAIIPIYSSWVMADMAGKPAWLGLYPLLFWVPVVGTIIGLVASLIIAIGLAERFGKSTMFGIFGIWLFGGVGIPWLAYGSAVYQEEVHIPEPGYPQL